MSIFIVDVESDGPCPGLYSMVSFGAIKVQADLNSAPTFYGKVAPISEKWIPEALAVSNVTREEHLQYPSVESQMNQFKDWIIKNSVGRPVFLSDNPAFDWQWINYYMHMVCGENPFGFSARRIGDFYSGLEKDWFAASKWKSMRKTVHTHHPVDDARGNAEAFLEMSKRHNVKIKF